MSERRHMILCTVTEIKDAQVVYPCCSQCCSKLRSDCFQDRWQCLKCGCASSNGDLDWRYRLSLMVSDGSALTNVCVFGSVLEQFFGMPSNQFVRFLRKVESMYGNSEEILLLGLKQCFIGSLFYFGIKAMTAPGKENTRTCLADVTQKRHTASQNIILTGGTTENVLKGETTENTNVIAFQMVPALDGEIKTVYDIVKNFFQDSNEKSVNTESNSCLHSFGNSYSHSSKLRADSFQRSKLNGEQSSVTFGQITALLSCEMDEISSSENTHSHVSLSHSQVSNSNVSDVAELIEKKTDIFTSLEPYGKCTSKKMLVLDNFSCVEEITQEKSRFRNCENKGDSPIQKKYQDGIRSNSIPQDKDESLEDCLHSEPLFSQEEISLNYDPNNESKNIESKALPYKKGLNIENIENDIDGTLLLQNLKLPDLPENIPDTEGLDSYLFNDSSFESDFHNGEENSQTNQFHARNSKQPLILVEESNKGNAIHTINFNKELVTDGDTGKSQEKSEKTPITHDKKPFEDNFDDLFEDSFDINECSGQPNIVECCTDKYKYHKERNISEDVKITEQNLKTQTVRKQNDNKMVNLDSEQVLSCAPDMSNMNDKELCLEFEKNLEMKITTGSCAPVASLANTNTFDYSSDLLYNSQSTELSEVIDKSHTVSYIDNTENNENNTCESRNNISNTGKSLLRNRSNISESVYLNASEDLFGETSITQESSKKSNQIHTAEIQSVDLGLKTSKKCVKFSRRLSCHKSVQLIDLQMKIQPNLDTLDKDARRKSCLKPTFNRIVESDQSYYRTKDNLCNLRILNPMENSPIIDNVNSVIMSQELFSPSPDIYVRRLKQMKIPKHDNKKKENCVAQNNNRTSSTPIELEIEEVCENVDYISKSLMSVFSESFEDNKENQADLEENSINNEHKSPALFSQSCSLFSFSSSTLSQKKNNSSKSYSRGDNSNILHSVNYSCDLFSPSIYESKNSVSENMPVKRLFSDKM